MADPLTLIRGLFPGAQVGDLQVMSSSFPAHSAYSDEDRNIPTYLSKAHRLVMWIVVTLSASNLSALHFIMTEMSMKPSLTNIQSKDEA